MGTLSSLTLILRIFLKLLLTNSPVILVNNLFQGLSDTNPFSALMDNPDESMTEFPPIPTVKKIGNEKFPFDTTETINPVCPAVRDLNFIADQLTTEDHVGMSDPEDASEEAQSDEEKPKEKVGKKKSKKKK